MKKFLRAFLCILLAFTLMLPLAACNGDDDDDGGKGEKNPTYLTRAKELAENIDKVPSMSALCDMKSSASGASILAKEDYGMLPLACPSGYTDVTDPKNNPEYQSAIATGRPRQMDMYATSISNSDLAVKNAQNAKKKALDEIIQLGVWVKTHGGSLSTRQRMSYDALSDTVTIEVLDDYDYLGKYAIQYHHITSTYNEKGEVIVRSYFYSSYDGVMNSVESIFFEENNYFAVVLDSNGNPDIDGDEIEYDYFCYSDLTSEGKDTMTFHKLGSITTSRTGANRAYIYSQNRQSNQIRFESALGERLGYMNVDEGLGIDINFDVYALDGVTGIYKNGNSYKLDVGGEPIKGGSFFDGCWSLTQVMAAPNENYVPMLRVGVVRTNEATLYEKEILDGMLADLGITIADESAKRQFEIAEDFEAFYDTFRIIKGTGFKNIDAEWVGEMMEKYSIEPRTPDEIAALTTQPVIEKTAQKEDESYYAVFSAQFTGNVTFDTEALTVDFGAISVTANESAMLEKGGEYALVAALWDGSIAPVSEKTAVWNGGQIAISGLGTLDIKTLDVGQYTLRVFLAKKTENGYTRMSSFFAPTTAQPTETTVTVGELIYTVKADTDVISITVEPVPPPPETEPQS